MLGQRVRALRTQQHMTLEDLADKSGLSVAFLSQLERDLRSNPSLASIRRIAQALNVSLFTLLAETADRPRVIREGQGTVFRRPSHNATFELLCPHVRGRMEVVMTTLDPGMSTCDEPLPHEGEEFTYVLEGTVLLEVGEHERYTLTPGDTIYFESTAPHRYTNTDQVPARMLVVMSPPSF